MKAELIRVRGGRQEMKRLKHLYCTAFPPEERAPFFILRSKQNRNTDWWNIYCDGQWAGFFYVVRGEGQAYVFFFAIEKELRGHGCGTAALAALKERYQDTILFLAIEEVVPEAVNYEERVKRKRFYQRSGFSETGTRVLEGQVIFELLAVGGKVSAEGYLKIMHDWMGILMRKSVRIQILPPAERSVDQ